MMPVALVTEGGAFHEDVVKLAPVAPESSVEVLWGDLPQVLGAVDGVEGLALRADVVREVMQFSLDAAFSGVVGSLALATEQGSVAESTMGEPFTELTLAWRV